MTRLEIEVNGVVITVKRKDDKVSLFIDGQGVDMSRDEAGWIITALIEITDEMEKPESNVHSMRN